MEQVNREDIHVYMYMYMCADVKFSLTLGVFSRLNTSSVSCLSPAIGSMSRPASTSGTPATVPSLVRESMLSWQQSSLRCVIVCIVHKT